MTYPAGWQPRPFIPETQTLFVRKELFVTKKAYLCNPFYKDVKLKFRLPFDPQSDVAKRVKQPNFYEQNAEKRQSARI